MRHTILYIYNIVKLNLLPLYKFYHHSAMDSKYDCFEAILDELFTQCPTLRDLTILKSLKLLFFICAIKLDGEGEIPGLLSIFNKFAAMPYGPVESDIYNKIQADELKKYCITPKGCSLKNPHSKLQVSEQMSNMVCDAVGALLKINPSILNYTAFQLVEISHKWSCWQICYKVALDNNKASVIIPSTLIQNSTKYYSL